MTIRPHDTEQILDTLSEAIGNLRDLGFGYAHRSMANDIANNLALLHGAVEAEAKKADEELDRFKALLPVPEGARPKPIDVKPSPGHRARYLGGTVTGDDPQVKMVKRDPMRYERDLRRRLRYGSLDEVNAAAHEVVDAEQARADEIRERYSRADKRKRIADEVERGEHRDD